MTDMKMLARIVCACLVTALWFTPTGSSEGPPWFEDPDPVLENKGDEVSEGYDDPKTALLSSPMGGNEQAGEEAKGGIDSENHLLSINFVKTEIREVLSALAMEREINIAIAKDVSGPISIHLYHVTLEEALDAITVAGGARYRKQGYVYYVYKPMQEESSQAEERNVRVFELKYADIDKIQEILESVVGSEHLEIHEPSRTIVAEDTPENIRKIEQIVNHWDARPRQVMIEAKILEIRLTDSMSLGVNWEQLLGDVRIATGGFSRAVSPTTEGVSPVPSEGSGLFGNMLIGAGTSYQFTAAIDALQEETDVNTLSTPKILALHGKEARVQVGGQQGYRVTTSNLGVTSETIEFIDTGTILNITPYITETGDVLMNVKPEITTAEIQEGGIPVTRLTIVDTWLLSKSGDTVFIGGLIQDIKIKNDSQVPVLGGMPVLGNLFGKKSRATEKTELIVLITPLVVDTELDPVSRGSLDRVGEAEKELFEAGTNVLGLPTQSR
jgi:type II secretory pathway component GspD/PulD (secretin)